MGAKHFGARVKRLEDPALLSGRGRFVDDLKLASALHACFVRSPYAHAKARIHRQHGGAGDARRPCGDHRERSARADAQPCRCRCCCPIRRSRRRARNTALARDEVCYVGQADRCRDRRYALHRRRRSRGGHRRITTCCPAVGDCRAAIAETTRRARTAISLNRTSPQTSGWPTATSMLRSPDAAHVFEEELWQHRGGGMAMETRAVLASHDPASDLLTVWSGTQTPHHRPPA